MRSPSSLRSAAVWIVAALLVAGLSLRLEARAIREETFPVVAGWNLIHVSGEPVVKDIDETLTLLDWDSLWTWIPPREGGVSPGPLHAWPSLDPLRPGRDLEGEPPLAVFDAGTRRWLRRDPALPAFLSEAPGELGSAQCFWSGGEVRFRSGSPRPASIVHYHADAVGSVAALTDEGGALLEERARYPFGAIRSLHRPGAPLGGTDHDFTEHAKRATLFGPAGTMDNIARDIHQELRKVALNIGISEILKESNRLFGEADKTTNEAKRTQLAKEATGWIDYAVEKYGQLLDPSTDPANQEFNLELQQDQKP